VGLELMLTILLFGTDTGEYGMTERVLQELSFCFPANLLDGPPHLLLLLRPSIGWSMLYIPGSYVRRGSLGSTASATSQSIAER
jgi:hypothetical protein